MRQTAKKQKQKNPKLNHTVSPILLHQNNNKPSSTLGEEDIITKE